MCWWMVDGTHCSNVFPDKLLGLSGVGKKCSTVRSRKTGSKYCGKEEKDLEKVVGNRTVAQPGNTNKKSPRSYFATAAVTCRLPSR